MDREGRERERERVYKVILVNKKRERERASSKLYYLITKVFVIWQNIYKKMNWMLIILRIF